MCVLRRVDSLYEEYYVGGGLSLSRWKDSCVSSLSDNQKKIIAAVYKSGGGSLIISNLTLNGGKHAARRAVDFIPSDSNWRLVLDVYRTMMQIGSSGYAWEGGLGIALPGSNVPKHLHVDWRGDEFSPKDRYAYFIETKHNWKMNPDGTKALDAKGKPIFLWADTVRATPDSLKAIEYGYPGIGIENKAPEKSQGILDYIFGPARDFVAEQSRDWANIGKVMFVAAGSAFIYKKFIADS